MPDPANSYIKDSNAVTYPFIDLRNPVRLQGQMLDNISRDGVDGDAWRKKGKRGQQFEMVGTRDFGSFNDSDTFYAALNDLRGQVVQVFDSFATEYHCMLLDVVRERQRPALSAVGGVLASAGGSVALADFRFTLWHQP